MCFNDDDDSEDLNRTAEENHIVTSPLLLPNELEHEVPSLSSSNGLGWVVLDDGDDRDSEGDESRDDAVKKYVKMFLIFVCLVAFGVTNSVSAKLQAIPMYNYPTFLNLFGNLLYVIVCFLYIIPVSYFGWWKNAIPPELWDLPKRPFLIMGSLDSLATTMQVFAAVYLPGPLMVLLLQSTIPISMVMSRLILGEKYHPRQYLGAFIVLLGIFLVLEPVISQRLGPKFVCEAIEMDDYCTVCQVERTREACMSHRLDSPKFGSIFASNLDISNQTRWNRFSAANITNDDDGQHDGIPVCKWIPSEDSSSKKDALLIVVWSLMIIVSCLPTTVSSIYKQITFSLHPNLDPIFLNGWVSLFQLLFSLCLVVPSGMATTPTVQPHEVLSHLWSGLKCFGGYGSIESGCHPDTLCSSRAALFVIFSLFCSVFYNFFMLLVLKYGSTALLYLALTVMVPLGNLAFGLTFLPRQAQQPPSLQDVSDLVGLAVILGGLVLYRFGAATSSCSSTDDIEPIQTDCQSTSCCDPGPFPSGEQRTDGPSHLCRQVSSLREPLLSNEI